MLNARAGHLLIPMLAALCACVDKPSGDVPCELVDAHLRELAGAAAPSGMSVEDRDEVAKSLEANSPRGVCADLSASERDCQMRATTWASALACAPPPRPADVAVEDHGVDGISGPTAAPPLSLPSP